MLATIIIGTAIIGAMILSVIHQVKKLKNGESSCGCGCSGCSSAKSCHKGIDIKKD